MENRREMYILLELVEERTMTGKETEDFVMDYTNTIDIDWRMSVLERFVGTRFFRAPASLFFTDEELGGTL